jgi:hypothetical protein
VAVKGAVSFDQGSRHQYRARHGDVLKKKFHERLKKNLRPPDLVKEIGRDIASIDVGNYLKGIHTQKEKLFLGSFNAEDVSGLLEQAHLFSHLDGLGYADVKVMIDVDDSGVNYLKLFHKSSNPENLLFDLRLSESTYIPDKVYFDGDMNEAYDMIVIEWLSSQDPHRGFSSDRPQLPGQDLPGLGILRHCFEIMCTIGQRLNKDGFLDIPDHIHGAIMYAKEFKFFDPAHEGVLRALMRDLKRYSLSDISWGIITRTIMEKYKNEPQPYDPSEQVYYISPRLRRYFLSKKYKRVFRKYYRRKHFRFDYDEMLERRKKILETRTMNDL